MSVNPSVIVDVWQDMWPSLTTTFQSSVNGAPISATTIDVSPNGSCAANQGPPGPNQPTCYSSGQGTVSFSGMKISNFTVTNGKTAVVKGSTASLPMTVSVLETSGSYNYNQPCTCEYMKIKNSSSAGSNGSVTQTMNTFTLTYECSIATDGKLSITDVSLNGTPNTHLDPDTGLPGWFSKFISAVTGDAQVIKNLQVSCGTMFKAAEFSTVLIEKMNKEIQKTD